MIIDATGWEHEPTPWAARAACAGTPAELWFPDRGRTNIAVARAVCNACPVRRECLDYASRWDIQFGIWGGLTEKERRRLGRPDAVRRIPAAHGTTTRYARGCRCTGCRRANYEYQESRRQPAPCPRCGYAVTPGRKKCPACLTTTTGTAS